MSFPIVRELVQLLQWAQGPILAFIVIMLIGLWLTLWSYRVLYPYEYSTWMMSRRRVRFFPNRPSKATLGLRLRPGPDGKLVLK